MSLYGTFVTYRNNKLALILSTNLMIDDEASVAISLKGRTVAIFSRSRQRPSFSIVTELPPVSLVSTPATSTTTLVASAIKV